MESVTAVQRRAGEPDRISPTQIASKNLNGLSCVTLSNGVLEVAILPQLGGKMISLKRAASGREFLLQPPERPYSQAEYGARFEDYDTSGFDECMPTVAACEYPEGRFCGTALPDHGELWPIPWQHEFRGNELWLAAAGRRLPYIFRKRLCLEDDTVVIAYELESVSDEPFRYLWSAHPLLIAESGCRICLPGDVSRLLINSSHRDRLGSAGSECAWPIHRIDEHDANLSVMGSRSDHAADKLFTGRLSRGWCALYYPSSDESIEYRFDASTVPYVGIWICQGGWPNDQAGHFTVALEPCTSRCDSLAEAMTQYECETLSGRTKKRWEIRMKASRGLPQEKQAEVLG